MPTPTNNSGLRDNHTRGTVADFLRAKTQSGSNLSIVSAYFTIYAFDALKEELERIEHLDFLFGEPSFVNRLDPSKTEKKAFLIDAAGLELSNKLQQKRVARECADWIDRKVDIKTIKQSNLLHGKMYHVATAGVEDAILGSSNFTVRGLGLGSAGNNIELNLIVDGNRDRQELKQWFDELWGNNELVKDVKQDVLAYLKQLYENHSPEFIYYKTLFHIFEKFLGELGKTDDELGKTSLFESQVWKTLFDFQKDGAKGVINKILAHNGCILADSVGLGKTYEALAVIKFFETRNERVLVLCPKKLRENWAVYQAHANNTLNPFPEDRFAYSLLHHSDLSRDRGDANGINLQNFNWGAYDLVVIDESHNFRNNTKGKRDDSGEVVRLSRYERLMQDIIQSGVRTKVLLLSATPVNNTLSDIRNQISIIAGGDVVQNEAANATFQHSLGIASLKETLRQAQTHFASWAKKKPDERTVAKLLEDLGADFFKLLDALTISRSRRHIERYYKSSLAAMGGFPKRAKPISIYPELDTENLFMSYDKLNTEISAYKLSLYTPSQFLKPEHRAEYERKVGNFNQLQREGFLIGMMKVGFLKRLESSVHSFTLTLQRTLEKIKSLEERLEKFRQFQGDNPDIDLASIAPEDLEDEDMRDALEVGKKLTFKLAHIDLDKWIAALHEDRKQLHAIYLAAKDIGVQRDGKLAKLKQLIREKVSQPSSRKDGLPNRKLIVFTAFSDTATYLHDALQNWVRDELKIHLALVTGSGPNQASLGSAEFNQILTNFSPEAKNRARIPNMPQTEQIELLIATDCISEGQNLQDCDTVINYDIHWNPVRIIQRFGRVDRLKSPNTEVRLINFWPTPDLNKYINLKHRVEARMALVDITAAANDGILGDESLAELVEGDLTYRDRQLKRLQQEVLDMDELNEGSVSLTEFTLDDFRLELLKYIEANKAALEDAPFGLYTCVPPHPDYKVIGPGVIFCFRQGGTDIPVSDSGKQTGMPAPQSINPLHPYFLVYVLDDGNVRFSFAHPKQILDIYRILCSGKAEAHGQLCNLFDQETNHGSDMKAYDTLLQKAVDSLAVTFRKRAASGLQSGRGFVLPNAKEQVHEKTDLELVTWLVIKAP
ncbi:MAG: helicase-related protein [Prosthecobacter sp.]|uniref:helicase-related protein n=1 Tax=Prosthecobacter sp. TaxID=1965333 RepID=UPI0039000C59